MSLPIVLSLGTKFSQAIKRSTPNADLTVTLSSTSIMSDQKVDSIVASSTESEPPSDNLHYARRGSFAENEVVSGEIKGYDDRMRGRTLLTVDEEKKLIRKIDLRLMTLCSIMFLLKNIDADNVSNARIMNRGQPSNIMTELGMTSNEYNLVTTMYYVSYTQRNVAATYKS
jgi:hypothetical protein